jgi:hypothetical protein
MRPCCGDGGRTFKNRSSHKTLLTDYGLTESAERIGVRLSLFCRLMEVRGINMTSGFSFAFPPERVPGILQAYQQKTKKVPPDELSRTRFVLFFGKYRQFGEEQEFRDVV